MHVSRRLGRKSALDLLVHLQLFTNPIQNGELLSPGNTLGTLIQLHQQKSNANSQSRFNKHNNNDTGKKYLQKTRHALKHFLNFPRKKNPKPVVPRTPAKASLQVLYMVYRFLVKARYRMSYKKQSICKTQTRKSQMYW